MLKTSLILQICLLSFNLLGQSFSEGWIISNSNDTCDVMIFTYKKKKVDNIYNCSQLKVIKENDTIIYLPKSIKGYYKNDVFYRSFNMGTFNSFFAKQLASGTIDLYFYSGNDNNSASKYILKNKNNSDFLVLDTKASLNYNSLSYGVAKTDQNGNPVSFDNNLMTNETSFIEYFSNYLADCTLVVNKLKAKYYAAFDLETIIKEYNKCND